jgi:hypothetical protein
MKLSMKALLDHSQGQSRHDLEAPALPLMTQLYGPAVRCKPNVNKWRGWSCASVSGPCMERLCSRPSWISARTRSHSRKGPERPLGSPDHGCDGETVSPFSQSNSQTSAGILVDACFVAAWSNLVRPRSIHCSLLLSPEVLKAIGRQFGVAHRVVGRLSPAVGVLAAMGEAETTQPRDLRCRPANYRPIAAEPIAARAMRSRCLGR